MKPKFFNLFAPLVLCLAFTAIGQTTQYVTVTLGNFPLQTNQLVSVIGYDWLDRPAVYGTLPNGNQIALTPLFNPSVGTSYGVTSAQIPQMVTGLTNILLSNGGGAGWATFQITTLTSATVISNYVPADAIVIPASATGNVQIILESSPDLVNWTAANPGTYGASAGTNRFFRVRAAVGP